MRLRETTAFFALALFPCALFGLVASLLIAGAVFAGAIGQTQGLAFRMLLKAGAFAVVAIGTFVALLRSRHGTGEPSASTQRPTLPRAHNRALFVILAVAGVVLLPRLDTYPYPEPDELHHLIVARNVAVYGEYASGHPRGELIHFDPYDSVGPPVILPIAGSLRLGGVSLAAGRVPIVVGFLALIVVAARLFSPWLGPTPAVLGGVFLLTAWGSIYLGRSVYGEAPALMFFIAALLLWRRSLNHRPWSYSTAAGIVLGLATLSKSIILLTAFPFAAAVLHDRLTHRQLRLPHVLMPAMGVAAVQAISIAAVALDGDAGPEGSTIGLYQHYLMFGLGGLPAAFQWIASNQLLFFAAALVGLTLLAPGLVTSRDPAILVALLTALFYLFWWCFFTDAHIPRYLWFSIALLSFPFAHLLWKLATAARTGGRPRKFLGTAFIVILCVPYGPLLGYETERIFGDVDVGADERRVMETLKDLPDSAETVTTWWPLERWANFFANRPMPVASDVVEGLKGADVVVSKGEAGADVLIPPIAARKIGPYVIYRKEP